MKIFIKILLAFIVVVTASLYLYVQNRISKMESLDPLVWESDIRTLEKSDEGIEFHSDAWLFVGSSSVALYGDLEDLMHPHQVISKGFGGASVKDIAFYQDQLIDKYHPERVVIYAGAVDSYIHYPNNPSIVVNSVIGLFDTISKRNDGVKIFYIAIRPTPFEPDKIETIGIINKAIVDTVKENKDIVFIDANNSVKDESGNYRKDIYKYDRTHLNNAGNKLWWSAIKKQLLGYSVAPRS